MKYMNNLLALQVLIYFVPTLILISIAVEEHGDQTKDDDKLSLYTLGALLKHNNLVSEEKQHLSHDDREMFIM